MDKVVYHMNAYRRGSMSIQFALIGILICQPTITSAQFPNILIHDGSRSCEPSIAIDPADPSRVVAASVLDNFYHSSDSGRTWQLGRLTSPYGVWGDPVIDVDGEGRFYFLHLSNTAGGSWIDRIVCQRSDDGGASWNDGSYVGLNGTKAQDKHWSVIDPRTNTIHLTWTQFDKYDSADPADRSNIMYSQSADGGETWREALDISTTSGDCLDGDDTVEGATAAIGPEGQLYVSWAGPEGLVFKKSLDDGRSWSEDEKVLDPFPGGWAIDIPGIYRCNGMPVTKCDLSDGPGRGTIYINWSDQRKGTDDTEVWLKKSTDGGESWSENILVNESIADSHQFFTWMDIDQSTGHLYFVYYTQRPGFTETEVMMALTKDGGETFYHYKVSERPFVPSKDTFFGDYNNISAHAGVVRPIWTRMDDKDLSVWTAIIADDLAERSIDRADEIVVKYSLDKERKVKIYYGGDLKRDFIRPRSKVKQTAGDHEFILPLHGYSTEDRIYYLIKAGSKVLAHGKYYLN